MGVRGRAGGGAIFAGALATVGVLAALATLAGAGGCSGFSGTPVDASARVEDDSAAVDPASPPGPAAQVDATDEARPAPNPAEPTYDVGCGQALCKLGELCCGATADTASCAPTCALPFRLGCDDADDCPRGSVCCATLAGARPEIERSACSVGACAPGEAALCHRDSQCGGRQCTPSRPDFLSACR